MICTPGHKFYLSENKQKRDIGKRQEHESYYQLSEKWVRVIDLKTKDKVLLENGKYGIIKRVTFQQLEIPETTYNFEVEDYHTYYVGNDGILTHNTGNCGVIDQSIPEGYEPTFKNGKYIANDGKHGSIRKGNISRNVPNLYGQYALDNSISFGGKARFAYNGKEIGRAHV